MAVLNRELLMAQEANDRLSEETMALEESRAERENLQAQLDKVQGELEEADRAAASPLLTDQV